MDKNNSESLVVSDSSFLCPDFSIKHRELCMKEDIRKEDSSTEYEEIFLDPSELPEASKIKEAIDIL